MRKSRRWLLASMGMTALGSAVHGESPAPSKPGAAASLRATACEELSEPVTDLVPLYAAVPTQGHMELGAPSLLSAFNIGFAYRYTGSTPLPDTDVLIEHLSKAYLGALKELAVKDWVMTVAQAFILGQLTRFFWAKKSADLSLRDLARAWGLFGTATSSVRCYDYIASNPTSKKKAYFLPKVPGTYSIVQIDEGCALC
jgi:hypothetical protein